MNMKKIFILTLVAAVLAHGRLAHATLIDLPTLSSGDLNMQITDGSPVGITSSLTENTAPDGNNEIQSVSVTLNISGGYNGDLVGYLVLQDANGHNATAILLNRVGTSAGDPFGSSGSGFSVTLSDSGTANGDIHNATGNPTGTWLADQYAGANSLNSTFGGLNANGRWTLFLADLSAGGGHSTLQNWGLNVSVVSEPVTSALGIFASLLLTAGILRQPRAAACVAAWWRTINRWMDAV